MAKTNISVALCVLVSLNLAIAAEVQERNFDETAKRRRVVHDPVSNFFSELGDFFLDVDREIAVQTAPKVETEDRMFSQILRPLQPRKEYFKRIQDNYRSLQKKLGSLIDETISPKTVQVEPLRRSNILVTESPGIAGENLPEISTEVPYSHHATEENPSYHKHAGKTTEEQIRKSMQKLVSDTKRRTEMLNSMESKVLDDFSLTFARKSGDAPKSEDKSLPQGRIIGDVLYSESRFDQYIRQLLRDHGKWILDNPLLTRWRVSSASRNNEKEETFVEPTTETNKVFIASTTADKTETEPTEVYMQTESEITEGFTKIPSNVFPLMSANYYRVDDDGKIEEEVDIVLKPESVTEFDDEIKDNGINTVFTPESYTGIYETEDNKVKQDAQSRDTVILAFTTDGVPLKLRMGPEIENPMMFLHRALKSAGVSLKVPVESYEVLEPVGKEVLLLGIGPGVVTRAVYLDISNPNELKSLLRTLMVSKVSEKR